MLDFLTMKGDVADNVVGIDNIGDKTAVKERESREYSVSASQTVDIQGKNSAERSAQTGIDAKVYSQTAGRQAQKEEGQWRN